MKPGMYQTKGEAARKLGPVVALGCLFWGIVIVGVWAVLKAVFG